MAAGSALFWVGSVWHGGGSNITEDRERQALFISHNCGWLRQQENQVISVPREIVREGARFNAPPAVAVPPQGASALSRSALPPARGRAQAVARSSGG